MKTTFKWLGLGVIVSTAILNMQPILELTNQVAGTITNIPFDWLFRLLKLGWLLWFAGRILETIVGIGLWLLIQTMELAPSILNNDVFFLKMLIDGFSRFTEEAVKSSDSGIVRGLKERYNESPKRWMAAAQTMRFLAYIAEFALACYRFPPYKGGYEALAKDLTNLNPGMANSFDVQKLFMIVLTMFAFEWIIWVLSWIASGGISLGLAVPSAQQNTSQNRGKRNYERSEYRDWDMNRGKRNYGRSEHRDRDMV